MQENMNQKNSEFDTFHAVASSCKNFGENVCRNISTLLKFRIEKTLKMLLELVE